MQYKPPKRRLQASIFLGIWLVFLAGCNTSGNQLPHGDTLSNPTPSNDVEIAVATLAPAPQATTEGVSYIAPTPSGKSLQPQLANADIDMNEVVALLSPDSIRAIQTHETAQFMITAAEAEQAGIDPDLRIIGVSINGESHAYPIPFLSRHEIVNAQLGGKAIATTW